jgi:hypothetical protein
MAPYGEFKVPEKVISLWHLNEKLIKVFKKLSKPFVMVCSDKEVTTKSHQLWCKQMVKKWKMPCETTWEKLAEENPDHKCRNAPAPDGFDADSTLDDLCPLECGWKKGVARWPPYLTSEEKAAKEEQDKKEAKLEADQSGE